MILSIIVAAPPGEPIPKSAMEALAIWGDDPEVEIIIARGRQPAIQRNRAVEQASGQILYFLDDDSIPNEQAIKQAIELFQQSNVAVVGGPNLCPKTASPRQQCFASIMGNYLAFGPSVARYKRVGERRRSSEKELILCNLFIRRDAFLLAGSFDESLYPNEENALMDKLNQLNFTLLYDPAISVERLPRERLSQFIRMLFNYGRGRAEQMRRHASSASLLNMVPAILVLWTLFAPIYPVWFVLSLILYFNILLGGTLSEHRHFHGSFAFHFLLLLATHYVYGIGTLYGFQTRLQNPSRGSREQRVQLEHLANPIGSKAS